MQTDGLSLVELVRNPPKIHGHRTITWGIHPRLATFLDDYLQPGHVSLETGSGLSTLVVLRKSVTRHIAIAPNPEEFIALRDFCREKGISTAPLEAVTQCSQEYLPVAKLPALDLVLVDGDHAFPLPFLDWYYTADRLVVGGLMIVDDIQLITGRILADFMDSDPKWECVIYEASRFAVYRKLSHPISGSGWMDQPYVADTHPVKRVHVKRARSGRCIRGYPRVFRDSIERFVAVCGQTVDTSDRERPKGGVTCILDGPPSEWGSSVSGGSPISSLEP